MRTVLDEDFDTAPEGALEAVTHCTLREQTITRLPAFGPALEQLAVSSCRRLASLAGIERCTRLAKLELGALSPAFDLAAECARLAELPELATLELSLIAAPPELAALPSLIELILRPGDVLDLASLGGIATLRRLVLRGVTAMSTSIGALGHLESLKIERSRKLRKIPRDLGKLTSLVELVIDAPIRTLDPSIAKCTRLEILDVGNTSITALPDNVGDLTRLSRLALLGSQVSKLPRSIAKLTELRWLSLPSDVELPDTIAQLSVEEFVGSEAIGAQIRLRAPATPYEDDVAFDKGDLLPEDLGDPRTLKLAVSSDHGQVTQLEKLRRVEHARLEVPDVRHALATLARCVHLDWLELREVTDIPDEIGALGGLVGLGVTGPITALPEVLGSLARLAHLRLECPHLVEVPDLPALETLAVTLETAELPAAFTRSTTLRELTIHCGNDVKSLEAIGRLAQLESLSLTGRIPDLDGLLHALATTRLRHLAIGPAKGRKLPASIGKLATLETLDLHHTYISELPYELRSLAALTRVDLPSREFDFDAIHMLPPIKWTKKKAFGQLRFEKSKR